MNGKNKSATNGHALSSHRVKSQRSENPSGELEIAIVKLLIAVGFQHKRIAALFDCNQGRIAEISKGHKGAEVSCVFTAKTEGKDVG